MGLTKGITSCYKLYPITVLSNRKGAYTLFMGKLNKFPMILLRKAISIVLLTAGMAGAINAVHAQPGRNGRDDAARAERRDQIRSNDGRQPDAGRPSQGAQGGQGADPGRHARMTPEERAALRRQINEAGQDIYVPRR